MVKFDKTVVIAAPLGEVFDYVSQPENFPNFVSLTDFQFLTDKHRGTDTRIRYNFICGSKRILSECTLTELSIDKSVAFHTKSITLKCRKRPPVVIRSSSLFQCVHWPEVPILGSK